MPKRRERPRVLVAPAAYGRDLEKDLEKRDARVIACPPEQLTTTAARRRPDAVLLGPDAAGNTAQLVAQVSAVAPEAAIVCISERCDLFELLMLLRAGAAGLLPVSTRRAAVAKAVIAAISGESPITRRLVQGLAEEFRSASGPVSLSCEGAASSVALSQREWEVLCLLRQDLSTRDISERLFISQATVRSHVAAIKRKLGVDDRSSMLRAAASA